MSSVFSTPDFVRSRRAYMLENSFEYGVTLLVSDVFLSKILSSIGFSDAAVGVIASLFTLAYLVQLLSALVVRKITRTRRFATAVHMLGSLLFTGIYVIPFLPVSQSVRQVIAVVFLFTAYGAHYFVASMLYKWGNSFVDPLHRAEFSAGREMLALSAGMVLTLLMGWGMDRFEATGSTEGAFLFCAAAMLIFCICDFVCLLLMRREYVPAEAAPSPRSSLGEVMRGTLGNVNFRRICFLQILVNIATYSTVGFLGTYQINPHELAFSVGTVQLINLAGNAARFLLSRPLGRYADRTSFARALEPVLLLGMIAFGLNAFTTPATRYLTVIFTVLRCCSLGGMSNMSNIVYSYVDAKYFAEATAIKNGTAGIVSFLASVLGGFLLEHVQNAGNTFFGMPVYGQQVLSALSAILYLIALLFLHTVIGRQTVQKQ